jgi:hypothetical protein
MKVITAPNIYNVEPDEVSVFLAGGITNCPDWQKDIINKLQTDYTNLDDKLVIFNPRRENFPIGDKSASYKQIEWEFNCLEKADIFSMYFTSGISDQPICMYELGRYISRMQAKYPVDWKYRIIISVEDGYKRKEDVLIQTHLACGADLFVNAQISDIINKDYHAEMIVRAYNYCIRKDKK